MLNFQINQPTRKTCLLTGCALAAGLLLCLWILRHKAPVRWTPELALHEASAFEPADDSSVDSLISALDASLAYYEKLDPAAMFRFGPRTTGVLELKASLLDFKAKLKELGFSPPFFEYVRHSYSFFQSAAPRVLYTGYYLPLLNGSYTKSARFTYPLYRTPDDFYQIDVREFPALAKCPDLPATLQARLTPKKHLVPYYSREEIDYQGMLSNQGREIVWVDSAVDAFFLHIQGSGLIALADGSKLLLSFADKNGRSYRSIGALLVERGVLPKENVSMQSIKSYLHDHPEMLQEAARYNPSYVFFKLGNNEAVGNIGVPLTPYRSIATDSRLIPKGALAIIKTRKPVFGANHEISGWQEFMRFALNQDTGGALRGPGRVDLFTGAGAESELTAGYMKEEGELYFLLKKRP